jgi:hypothetical protein
LVHRILALIIAATVWAGPLVAGGSVFSANGAGEQLVGGGTRAQALGGGAFGLKDSVSFNTRNPALAAFSTRTSVRLSGQLGFWSTTADGKSDADAEFTWRDLSLFIPLTRVWKLGFVAEPIRRSSVQTFANKVAVFTDTSRALYERRDTWQGGATDLKIVNGFRVNDNFSLGLAAIYTIARQERRSVFDFEQVPDQQYYFDAAYREAETFRAWSGSVGVYYQPTTKIGIGAVYRPRTSGNWRYEYQKSGSDSLVRRERHGDSPGEVLLGLSYHFQPHWIGVLDAQLGQWSAGDLGVMADSSGLPAPENPLFLSVGLERAATVEEGKTGAQYWGYRGGLYYRQHYWPKRNGTAVQDLGVTLGASIPVNNGANWVHWAIETGLRGLDEKKLGATETYVRTSLQFEMSETWFQRTRPRIPK